MAETTFESAFRDFVNPGVPSSGAYPPKKADIRATLQGRVGYAIGGREAVKTDDYTVVAADGGWTIIFNKATAVTASLTAVATLAAAVESNTQFQVRLFNIGAGVLTIDPNASETINGATTLDLRQYESATIWTDGSVWWADIGGGLLSSNYFVAADLFANDLLYNPSAGGTGFFSDYECRSTISLEIEQAEDNTGTGESGVIVDLLTFHHVDEDTEDYTSAGVRAISNAGRFLINGSWNGTGFDAQTKDLVGIDAHAIGRITDNNRGVSGIAAGAIQYGSAIASNEFAVENPAAANEQSVSMAAVQAIVRAYKAAADGSHLYTGVLIQNDQGYSATSGVRILSTDGGGSTDGSWARGIDMVESVVSEAAIKMPRGGGAGDGIIDYAANYYSNFNVGASRFDWIANGNVRASIGNNGFAAGTFHGGTAFLEVAAGTSSIQQVYLASSAAPSSPVDGTLWNEAGTLKFRTGGTTYNIDLTAA